MAQLLRPVEPFGEVNIHRRPDGTLQVIATILMEPDIEGALAGLALDGSASMKKMYGANTPLSPLFQAATGTQNFIEPVARMLASYLARFASDGKAHLVYWACGPDGSKLEGIGDVNEEQAKSIAIRGPQRTAWGRLTKLLPPVRYFVEDVFLEAPWGICVILTDGVIEDLPAVKEYCLQFAHKIARGQRRFVKFVLVGVGEEVDEAQMEELDDMFEGTGLVDPKGRLIDLWDHKLASEMRSLAEIFAEVVEENLLVAGRARILDGRGNQIKKYSDGLPALLRFTLPGDSRAFTLEMADHRITQDLSEALERLS